MVRHTRPALVVALIGLAVMLATPRALAFNLSPAPFDAALSMYVGCAGDWYYTPPGDTATTELEAELCLYAPNEEVTDDDDSWCAHQVNQPSVPTGWQFWYTDDEQPMTLHVIVHDTQNRLGEVTVVRLASGAPVGTLSANQQGSEIDGTLSLTSPDDSLVLVVKASGSGTPLMKAGAANEGMNDVITLPVEGKQAWVPNSGVQTPPGYAFPTTPPYGDPRSVAGITTVSAAQGNSARIACAGVVPFVNDTDEPGEVGPQYYPLLTVEKVKDTMAAWAPSPRWSLEATTTLRDAWLSAEHAFDGGTTVMTNYASRPYSQGTATWHLCVKGVVRSLLYVPCKSHDKTKVTETIEVKLPASIAAGNNQPDASIGISVALGLQLQTETVKRTCGPPVAVGDVWGLICTDAAAPAASPLTGIHSDVTFQLWGNITAPTGGPGPISGNGTLTLGTSWTTPASPPANPSSFDPLTYGQNGQCTVSLSEGWRYTVRGASACYAMGTTEFQVPPGNTVYINCDLQNLLSLKIKTTHNGQPVSTPLELQWKPTPGAAWTPLTLPQRQYVEGEWVTFVGTRPTGDYRVRGRGIGVPPPPWSDWQEFTVVPALEYTAVVDVP